MRQNFYSSHSWDLARKSLCAHIQMKKPLTLFIKFTCVADKEDQLQETIASVQSPHNPFKFVYRHYWKRCCHSIYHRQFSLADTKNSEQFGPVTFETPTWTNKTFLLAVRGAVSLTISLVAHALIARVVV